jgi:hypothetical protein
LFSNEGEGLVGGEGDFQPLLCHRDGISTERQAFAVQTKTQHTTPS